MAAGINLSWDDCGMAGASSKFFSCDSNDGQDVLVASAQPPASLDSVCGFIARIMVSGSSTIPDWCHFRSPTDPFDPFYPQCRDTAGVHLAIDPSSVSCPTIFGDASGSGSHMIW